jgi:WD40 repeat protein
VDLWSLDTAERLGSAPRNFGPFQDLVLSPDGRLAALAGYGHIELRNVSDGSLVRVIPGLPGPVRSLAFFPGGQTIVAAAGDGLARLYQVSNGRFLSTLGEAGPPLWSVAFSPDSKWLAWGGEGQRIFIYDLEKDKLASRIQEPFVPVRLEFSPDSGMLASLTSSGMNVRLLSGVLVRNAGGSGLEDMAFWLDGSQMAVAGNDVARMLDVNTGQDVVVLDFREDESPTAINFTLDGAFMVVGWSSGRLDMFWAGTKDLLRSLDGHLGPVRKIVFSKDGRLMLTYGEDGTVRVWGVTP